MNRQQVWIATFYHQHGQDVAIYRNEPTVEEIGRTFDIEPDREGEYVTINFGEIIENKGKE